MDDRKRKRRFRSRFSCYVVALGIAWPMLTGCAGPSAVRYTRLKYNEVVRDTNDQQLLVNIVRLRYADSPIFVDLPSITSQFEVAGKASYTGGYGLQFPGRSSLGIGEFSLRDSPTLSYHPREGREIAKGLLTPISADLFSVVNAGADVEQLLLLTVNEINDVSNAVRSTHLTPTVPDDNSEFLRGIHLLRELRDRDATELAIADFDRAAGVPEPLAVESLTGGDLLEAARGGYVYRSKGKSQVTLVKREKALVLRVRPAYVNSPEMIEVERIFRVTPGLREYRIKSEYAEGLAEQPLEPLGGDTIHLEMRSILQVMTFLSKGVCVPPEHVRTGMAPVTCDANGQPFDWTRVTAGNFIVRVQKHRPKQSEVAVHYRGYWFFIAPNDVRSRAMLAVLELLFALQESGDKSAGPLLTLPIGG